jgi:1-acyl-sn-glycerol-3-phosphate acyltransferase
MFDIIINITKIIMGTQYKNLSNIVPPKKCLLISNHPSYFDMLHIYAWAKYHNRHQDVRFVAKKSIGNVPLVGKIISGSHLLISRDFDVDKENIKTYCEKLNNSDSYILVIFPEGTTYAQCMINKSNEYCESNNINKFTHVLCPRYRGIETILSVLKPESILDMTIIYPDYHKFYNSGVGIPFASNEGTKKGEYPMYCDFLTKNVIINNYDDLIKIWREKNMYINNYLIVNQQDSYPDKIIRILLILSTIIHFIY